MTDITKCLNAECPKAQECYRFTAPASAWQSYSDFKPNEKGECEYFYDRK